MVASWTLSLVVTVVFAATGGYALLRLAASTPVGRSGDVDRAAEVSHLLMSLAMIAMMWGWTPGPTRPGGIAQCVVFGLFAVWFVSRAATGEAGHRRVSDAYHAVMAGAMTWMVVAMPGPGGSDPAAGTSSTSTGMPGMPGMSGTGGTGALRDTVVTCAFVVLLGAAAVLWAVRAFRGEGCAPGEARSGGPAPAAAPVATRSAVARLTGPRLDACCHLLMSLAMGGLLLAMT